MQLRKNEKKEATREYVRNESRLTRNNIGRRSKKEEAIREDFGNLASRYSGDHLAPN